MKFYGTPNMLVTINKNFPYEKIKHIRFDANGELEVTDPKIIKRMKRKFKSDDTKVLESDKKPAEPNLESLKRNELIKLYKESGHTYKVGIKNSEMIKLIRSV